MKRRGEYEYMLERFLPSYMREQPRMRNGSGRGVIKLKRQTHG